MKPGISAVAAATTLRVRFVITLLKTPAYRGDLTESRGKRGWSPYVKGPPANSQSEFRPIGGWNRAAAVDQWLRAPPIRLLDRIADRSCSCRQAGLEEHFLPFQEVHRSRDRRVLWRASL